MTLVAATTLGLSEVQHLRAEVSVSALALPSDGVEEYRLIVQSYSATNVVDGVPLAHARPISSAQRRVTPQELERGVAVDLVGVGGDASSAPIVVAWFERGRADLDFDARKARPGRDAYVGVAASAAISVLPSREAA